MEVTQLKPFYVNNVYTEVPMGSTVHQIFKCVYLFIRLAHDCGVVSYILFSNVANDIHRKVVYFSNSFFGGFQLFCGYICH